MFLVYHHCPALLLALTVAAAAVSLSQDPNDLLFASAQVSNLSLPTSADTEANVTLGLANPDESDALTVACNGAKFGLGLVYDTCLDAISTFETPIADNVTIGPRGQRQRYNFHLPWRWISSDGSCAFDVVKNNLYLFALATPDELRKAATTLLNTCVRNRGGKGGIVTNVGKLVPSCWNYSCEADLI